jgi:arylsulfatase A-like enzyme
MTNRTLFSLLGGVTLMPMMGAAQTQRPNIIIMNIDDMGYSDPSCFGGDYVNTTNIDRLASEGLSLTQFYTACPISSPSRVGLTTGMYPTRWGINTFLQERVNNAKNEQNDFLTDRAPSMARALKNSGYATRHFGKWHMGGGRDVKNAPSILNYGFDEYVSTWESPDPDPLITSGNWIWQPTDSIKRWNRTAYFVDKTLDFLALHKDRPCFVSLWPDDVHTPWVYEGDERSQRQSAPSFAIVLAELDRQIGRFMQGLKNLGIDQDTIVIFIGDNGPAPAFDGHRTNDLRGQKGTLYEGGIRMPFIIRWPDHIPAGMKNDRSVVCMVDLFPSLCKIAGAELPTDYPLDGIDMSDVITGQSLRERATPLFWEFGKCRPKRVSPHIAVREGEWKLLVNADGSRTELYNMTTDFNEKQNVAADHPFLTQRLKQAAIDWFNEAYRQYADSITYVSPDKK